VVVAADVSTASADSNNKHDDDEDSFRAFYGMSKMEWKKEVALKQVKRLSGQIGLRRQVPKVIFDPAEFDESMKELINKHEAPDWHQNCYGAYFPRIHAVYLNLSTFGNRPGSGGFIADLIETIAHELAHSRFPALPPHGDEFERRVKEILNRKRFPWIILVIPREQEDFAALRKQ
jgi:hypothetical protein